MKTIRLIATAVVVFLTVEHASAQTFALKTNLLGWATTTLNVGAEAAVGEKSTVQLFGSLNPWQFKNEKRFRFWNIMPEYRHWFCQRFNGHFVGIHATGGEFNAKNIDMPFNLLEETTCNSHNEGWYIGGGVTYGYQWILSEHWNLEASLGVGYMFTKYKQYGSCEEDVIHHHRNYVGPTKFALSLMYCF